MVSSKLIKVLTSATKCSSSSRNLMKMRWLQIWATARLYALTKVERLSALVLLGLTIWRPCSKRKSPSIWTHRAKKTIKDLVAGKTYEHRRFRAALITSLSKKWKKVTHLRAARSTRKWSHQGINRASTGTKMSKTERNRARSDVIAIKSRHISI